MSIDAPWTRSFLITDPTSGASSPGGAIALYQIDLKEFALASQVTYVGARTGLEGKVDDGVITEIRRVGPDTLPTTDLTSVPQALRWLVGQYGSHTPAALIHDRLIGADGQIPGLTDAHADRYFRFILHDLGVRWLRRWLMWSAVALRTRWKAGGIRAGSVFVWAVASLTGMSLALGALVNRDWPVLGLTGAAPFVFAVLWGRRYGAGLVAAFAAPWVLPPTLFGAIGFLVYAAAEWFFALFLDRDKEPVEPLRYRSF